MGNVQNNFIIGRVKRSVQGLHLLHDRDNVLDVDTADDHRVYDVNSASSDVKSAAKSSK